jgi:hypothetical protein
VQEYNNILNRNIDDILSRNRNSALQLTRRSNKYMNKYEQFSDTYRPKSMIDEPVKTHVLFEATNRMDCLNNANPDSQIKDDREPLPPSRSVVQQHSLDGCDAVSSDMSTCSSVIPRCDVKSQPLMSFSSIAYVNANRALQLQQLAQTQHRISGDSFGNPKLSTSLPAHSDLNASLLFDDTIEQGEAHFDRIARTAIEEASDVDSSVEDLDEDDVVDAIERALEEELEANAFEAKLNHHLELLHEISSGTPYDWIPAHSADASSYGYSSSYPM